MNIILKFFAFFVIILLCSVSVLGGMEAGSTCDTDDDCGINQRCMSSICTVIQQPDNVDEEINGNTEDTDVNADTGVGVFGKQCSPSQLCSGNSRCGYDNICGGIGAYCKDLSNSRINSWCISSNCGEDGKCHPKPGECYTNADCAKGEICLNSICKIVQEMEQDDKTLLHNQNQLTEKPEIKDKTTKIEQGNACLETPIQGCQIKGIENANINLPKASVILKTIIGTLWKEISGLKALVGIIDMRIATLENSFSSINLGNASNAKKPADDGIYDKNRVVNAMYDSLVRIEEDKKANIIANNSYVEKAAYSTQCYISSFANLARLSQFSGPACTQVGLYERGTKKLLFGRLECDGIYGLTEKVEIITSGTDIIINNLPQLGKEFVTISCCKNQDL